MIHDLGGGDGSMGRWLAPRLRGPQHWVVHDRDADLLERAAATPPARVTVETRQSDVTRLEPHDLAGASLIVASALLDILSAGELDRMLGACTAAGCPMLLALTVVGRVALRPSEPLDARGRRRLQRPPAPRCSARTPPGRRRRRSGGRAPRCSSRPSPWRLDAADAELTAEWLEGWIAAACEQAARPGREARAYRDRRLAQAAAGRLAVRVGHVDLLVLP